MPMYMVKETGVVYNYNFRIFMQVFDVAPNELTVYTGTI